ncbi:MAG: hypothetical protein RI955_296 [Bacteroidota bacterium]|jgi:hypothetical protein
MNKINSLLIAIGVIFMMACHSSKKVESNTKLPNWLAEKIVSNENLPNNQSIQKVMQGKYHGEVAYYIISPCCDQLNDLRNVKGELICHPNGGMIKGGDGKCLDFQAEYKGTIIWVRK